MTRFLQGLNRDIQDIVELHNYTSLHGKGSYPTTSSNLKDKERREDKPLKRDKSPKKGSAPFKGQIKEVGKVSIPNPNSFKSSNIECFKCLGKRHIASQCPNKSTMILRENGEIESESSQEETSTSSSENGYSSEEAPYEGYILMIRRLMSTFVEMTNLKEKIHFTLGSSVNVASQRLVSIVIALGKYKDGILCDVVPIKATHYDRKVTHDEVTNKFSFMHMGHKVTLKSLSPKEVLEDQIK
ncbi:hypothetical protein CR513_03387, partial [Mucuna pruriens]